MAERSHRAQRPRAHGRPENPFVDRDQKERWVLGLQPVREAIRVHQGNVFELWLQEGDSERLAAVERFARDQAVPVVRRVPRADLDRLTPGALHQGLAARVPPLVLCDLQDLLENHRLLLALDKVQDPQNFGAVLRSAVGVASVPVVWGEHDSAPLTPATFRASAGAVEHAKLCRVPSLRSALSTASSQGFEVVGLDAEGPKPLDAVDLRVPTVLVMGSEHKGLSRGVRQQCTQLAHLPMAQGVASLNVSVAAAIALYEASSQCRLDPLA